MRQSFSPKLRKQILNRDGNRCQVCHSTESLEVDHCLPVCLGGNNNPLNLRVLCSKCNVARNRDIKNYRTKRVRQHVKKMEADKDSLLAKKEAEVRELQRELDYKGKEVVWLKERNTYAWEQIEFLQRMLTQAWEIVDIYMNTINVMQAGRRL